MRKLLGGVAGVVALGLAMSAAWSGGCVGAEPVLADGGPAPLQEGATCAKTCNGECITTLEDPARGCGAIDCTPCGAPSNAAAICESTRCATKCNQGFDDCDTDRGNGCETPVVADEANCGKCRNVCGTANATPTCTNGKCAFACGAGFAHCGTDDSKGCETDTRADKNNCGACGRSCLGGACVDSKCQPVVLHDSAGGFPTGIAIDATHGYVVLRDARQVLKVPLDGSAPAQVLVPTATAGTRPVAIAVDGTHVYWANEYPSPTSDVKRAEKIGANVVTLGPTDDAYSIALGDGFTWWTNVTGTFALRRGKAGAGPEDFATVDAAHRPQSVVVDGTTVYWTDPPNGRVFKVPTTTACGTSCATLTTGLSQPYAVAVDATSVLVTELNAVLGQGRVLRYPKAGGGPIEIATGLTSPTSVASDGTYAYFTQFQGASPGLYRRKLTDGPCAGSACELLAPSPRAFSIAVDAKAVYWCNQSAGGAGGEVLKLAK